MSASDGITGIVMNKLEGFSVEPCKEACFKLLRWVSQTAEKFKQRLAKGRSLFSWVAWLLSKFQKGERPEAANAPQARTPDQKLCTRLHALKSWLALHEKEFEMGQSCGICKRKHTRVEYESGLVDDGSGKWNCMGWARVKLGELEDELHHLQKQREREEAERLYGPTTAKDKLAQWAAERLANLAWQKKQFEMAQQKLREQRLRDASI